MSRDVVRALLADDPELRDEFGIDQTRVLDNYTFDAPPTQGWFLVLRWEETTPRRGNGLVRILTVYAHRKRTETTDYAALDLLVDRTRQVLTSAAPTVGADGDWFTAARHTGTGRDSYDMGYHTITRNVAFEIAAGLTREG